MENEGMAGFRIKTRGGGGGGGGGGCGGTKCGRWNPTTEQVKVLTDLFRSGLRTPSTDQIQKISSQLSYYGKIESKNVFYWFQNHKARERQKRRRVYADEEIEIINREDNHKKVSSTKHFAEINQVMEPERVIETLQLFPQNSFNYGETTEKFMVFANECNKENASFAYSCGTEMDHRQPPLDLRLSFL